MSITRGAAPTDPPVGLQDTGQARHLAPRDHDADGPPRSPTGQTRRVWLSALQVVVAAVVGAVPVLWTMGALPWRSPTLLIENMFRGFTSCAVADGALNPIVMVCRRAGTPIGMYQLDGGVTYPLGGLLLQLGLEPVAAWKFSVAALIVSGVGALFWLLRRMTGSPLLAAVFVALNGLNGTLTARSWNWYWNVAAVALLPLLFAFLHVLYERAGRRWLRTLLPPGGAVLAVVLAIAVEWQYAGLFATAIAVGAVCLLVVQRGWSGRQRLLLALGGAVGVAVVVGVLRLRLTLAGVTDQYDDGLLTASRNSIDLASFVVPDARASLLGRLLARLGLNDLLVRSLAEGRQLWVSPYLGVVAIAFLLAVVVLLWRRRTTSPGLPPPFVALLLAVMIASIVLSTGPQLRLAGLAEPAAVTVSPLEFLFVSTPLRWIRFPWTWGFVTHIAGLLTCAALAAVFLRRGRSWSPLVGVLVVLLAVEFISPQVLNAFRSRQPSVASATAWTRIARDDATVERFEATAIPEFERALRGIDGDVLLMPWDNTYITPHLGPEVGAHVRNVGIDRNLDQVEAAAPFERHELRWPRSETIQRMLSSRWSAAVVLLDHVPSGESILRFDHAHLRERELAWLRRVGRLETQLARAGYCVGPQSWFTVVTECSDHDDLPRRAGRQRAVPSTADQAPADEATGRPDAARARNAAAERLRRARARTDAGIDDERPRRVRGRP